MSDFMTVHSCQIYDNGIKKVFNLGNDGSVIEVPEYPGKARFQFYDSRGRAVRTPSVRVAMKQAVERHKKRWRLAK